MSKSDNIFLVGLMGAGKSTIGQRLAKQLGKTFIDTDREIEDRTGVTIEIIFEIEGEAGFRKRESAVLEECTTRDSVVLATGGGAVLSEDNRRLLAERGRVVYLEAPPEVLARRMAHDRKRPLLQNGDRLARLRQLQAEREPFYRQIADVIITTNNLPLKRIVARVLKQLNEPCEK